MENSLRYLYKNEKCEERASSNTKERIQDQDQSFHTKRFGDRFTQIVESVEINN